MEYVQSKSTIVVSDKKGKDYVATYAEAEADGMTVPEFDSEKYDYRIYETNSDGSFKRHALIKDHGTTHDDGGENWQPGIDAFGDHDELCRRREAREKAAQEAAVQAEKDRIDAQNKAAEEHNAKLLADYTDQG